MSTHLVSGLEAWLRDQVAIALHLVLSRVVALQIDVYPGLGALCLSPFDDCTHSGGLRWSGRLFEYHFAVEIPGVARVPGCRSPFGSEFISKLPRICSNSPAFQRLEHSRPSLSGTRDLPLGHSHHCWQQQQAATNTKLRCKGNWPTPLSSGQLFQTNFVFAGAGHCLRLGGGVGG